MKGDSSRATTWKATGISRSCTVDQKGAYYALVGSDGKPIESDAPSGKFMGKDTAQEAAWTYENGLTTGE